MKRRRWAQTHLEEQVKNRPLKLALAAGLGRQAVLTVREMAQRLHGQLEKLEGMSGALKPERLATLLNF